MPRLRRTQLASTGLLLLLFLVGGCDRIRALIPEEEPSVRGVAPRPPDASTPTPAPQISGAAVQRIELDVEGPVVTSHCTARYITLGLGRPSVLQVASYNSPEEESYPSVFLRATANQEGLESLLGQELNAQLFVQTEPNGPIWHTPHGTSVQIRVTAIDADSVEVKLTGGQLIHTVDHRSAEVGGLLIGALR